MACARSYGGSHCVRSDNFGDDGMFDHLKQFLRFSSGRTARQFSLELSRHVQSSPSLTMASLYEWLETPAGRRQLVTDGLQKLHAVDARLRRLADDALDELLHASSQLTKTQLILRSLTPFATVLCERYGALLEQSKLAARARAGETRLRCDAAEALLYWQKIRFICAFVVGTRDASLPWWAIQAIIDPLFARFSEVEGVEFATDDVGFARLRLQLASLILLSRSLSSETQGRHALIAARVADHLARKTVIRLDASVRGPGRAAEQNAPTLSPLDAAEKPVVFYSLSENIQTLARLIEEMRLQNALPRFLREPAGLTVPEVSMVAKQLLARWRGQPHRRRAERKAMEGKVAVIEGLSVIGEQLTPAPYRNPVKHDAFTEEEKAALIDASAQGIGIKLLNHGGWIKPGQLLGVKIEGDPAWRIAVVRRARLEGDRQMFAGLEWLGAQPEPVKLKPQSRLAASGSGADLVKALAVDALVIRVPGPASGRVLVLSMIGDLARGERYVAETAEGKRFALHVEGEVELDCDGAVHFAQAQARAA